MIQNFLTQVRRTLWSIAASLLVLLAFPAGAQLQLLHPTNTVWRYQTNLLEQQAVGAGWVNPAFDDSAWPTGKGLFGNDTTIYPDPFNTPVPLPAPIGLYFRTHFNWSGSSTAVVLRGTNYVDDGSIIYLNGVEIARFNMGPEANAGTPDIPAPFANPGGYPNVNGGEPVLVRLECNLDFLTNGNANPLVTGDNVIAVQVHQNNVSSSDRVFGLSLYGQSCAASCFSTTSPIQPTNRVALWGRSTTFTVVEQCSVPTPTFQWYRDIGAGEELILGATGTSHTIANVSFIDSGVYYAKATTTCGAVYSRQATLTVAGGPEPPRLLSGRLGANNLEIIVTADKALCPDDACAGNATHSFNYEIFVEGDEGNQLLIAGVTVAGNVLIFTLDESTPWLLDTRYVVRLQLFGGGSIGDLYGNLLNGGDPFSSVTTPPAASAISVRSPGNVSDLYTFDIPPSAFEFKTVLMFGSAGDQTTAAGLEAAVQAINATTITTGLASATGTPPATSGLGQYASEGKYLITRPAGTLANNIIAHLRNDTGRSQSIVWLSYTLGVESPVTEEVPGHLVYYSRSGVPNSWLPIPGLSGDGTASAKNATIDLCADSWAPGASLYILWVDDNGSGSPDTAYKIDDLKLSALVAVCGEPEPPSLLRASAPNNTTIVLTFSKKMAASAGTTAPYSLTGGSTVTVAALSNDGKEVRLTTSVRQVGNATLTITGLRDAALEANLLYPNPTTVRITTIQKVANWADAWDYNTNNLDSAPTWKTTGGTGWLTGNALFGTETSPGVVAIMPTPIATVIPPPNTNNEFMVSYFRKTVTLPPLGAGQSYALGYMVDDGAVFYLDGVEIGRVNMPAGPVGYSTNAVAGVDASLRSLPFTAAAGEHVLAVEVHQNFNASSDTLFGASVLIVPTESPALNIVRNGTNAVVIWNADASWMLVGSTNVAGPYAPVVPTTSDSLIRSMATPATQFYKLNYIPQP